MASKFKKILDILFDTPETTNSSVPVTTQSDDYSQDPGTLTTVNAEEVQVTVLDDNHNVKVERRSDIAKQTMRAGGEEIKAGTLH